MIVRITAAQLRKQFGQGNEYALLDVRETGAFSSGHLFFASCLPLSRLELLMHSRLPRREVPIILLTESRADESLATRAAQILTAAGFTELSLLDGGTLAWADDGGEVFTGVNVPSKAFGEFIEHWHDTPRLPAEDLARRQDNGENLIILDSRPFDEFSRMSIPGGIDCPGAELVYRVRELVPDPTTTVVVNCAGRTRSIIGAQSLINAGVPNPVYALKDGTMGWKLAGLSLAHGESTSAPEPSAESIAVAREQTGLIAQRCGVHLIDPQELLAWQTEHEKSTYLLDVRTEQEFLNGHWPGAIHAPGGQLVQATDEYVLVRQSRLVLCDSPDGVRATMTAHWLLQLGWPEVRVLTAPPIAVQTGSAQISVPLPQQVGLIEPADLAVRLQGGSAGAEIAVLDLSSSRQYRQAHLPGSAWTVRARLNECVKQVRELRPAVTTWVVLADDDQLANLTCTDLLSLLPEHSIRLLAGGIQAWQAAGYALESTNPCWLTSIDDIWPKPGEGLANPAVAMQQYLTWEVGLVDQVNREGLANYRRLM